MAEKDDCGWRRFDRYFKIVCYAAVILPVLIFVFIKTANDLQLLAPNRSLSGFIGHLRGTIEGNIGLYLGGPTALAFLLVGLRIVGNVLNRESQRSPSPEVEAEQETARE